MSNTNFTPGIAHSFVSNRLIETNCNIGFLVSGLYTFLPFSSRFHLKDRIRFNIRLILKQTKIYYLVTTGSAAWLTPHLPS